MKLPSAGSGKRLQDISQQNVCRKYFNLRGFNRKEMKIM
jgi:hypothetical protein